MASYKIYYGLFIYNLIDLVLNYLVLYNLQQIQICNKIKIKIIVTYPCILLVPKNSLTNKIEFVLHIMIFISF